MIPDNYGYRSDSYEVPRNYQELKTTIVGWIRNEGRYGLADKVESVKNNTDDISLSQMERNLSKYLKFSRDGFLKFCLVNGLTLDTVLDDLYLINSDFKDCTFGSVRLRFDDYKFTFYDGVNTISWSVYDNPPEDVRWEIRL